MRGLSNKQNEGTFFSMVRGKHVYSLERAFEVFFALAKLLGKEERVKKWRPAIYPDELYIALLVMRSYFNWTYRETEAFFRDLFPGKPCPSFQSLHSARRPRSLAG